MKQKMVLAAGAVVLCAGLLVGCASSDPVDKYLRSFDKGDSAVASQVYAEEIKEDGEKKKDLKAKLEERIDGIYEDFKAGKITADEAKEKLKPYKEEDTASVNAYAAINKINQLQQSQEAYDAAEKAAENGNLVDAIANYKKVIQDDLNYESAQAKVLQVSESYTETMKAQAQKEADDKNYTAAANTIDALMNAVGTTDELKALAQQYTELKNYEYVKVICTDKGELPENLRAGRYSDYATFVFDVTNNSDKAIKGVQGLLHISDMFGVKIMDVRCDFTGYTIQPGETHTDKDLSFEINQFMDDNMKLYNTAYSDLIFEYEPTAIVFTDGSSVTLS